MKTYKTKLSTDNLCDSCDFEIIYCSCQKTEFGDGIGNDNVIECDSLVLKHDLNEFPDNIEVVENQENL